MRYLRRQVLVKYLPFIFTSFDVDVCLLFLEAKLASTGFSFFQRFYFLI